MRHVGIILGVGVAAVVALLLVAYVALRSVDWNAYKQPVADTVAEATGRRLALDGDLDLQIGLRPGIRLERVAFANADWGSRPEMVTADELVVRLRLLPLLSGEVVIDRIELVGLDVLLETREDGTVNWEFEPSAPEEEPSAPPEEPSAAKEEPSAAKEEPSATPEEPPDEAEALALLLHHVEIRDALVVIRDRSTGQEQRIGVERFVASTPDAESPLSLELAASYADEPISLQGQLSGLAGFLAGDALGLDLKLEAGGAVLDVQGDIADPQEGRGLALRVRLESERIAELGTLIGTELPDLPPLAADFALEGGGDRYAIRDLLLSLGSSRVSGDVDVALDAVRTQVDARLVSSRFDTADFQARGAAGSALRVRSRPGIQLVAQESGGEEPLFSRDPFELDGLATTDLRADLQAEVFVAGAIELSDLSLVLELEDAKLVVDRFEAELAGGRIDAKASLDAGREFPRWTLAGTAKGVRVGDLTAAGGSDAVRGGPLDLDFDLTGRGRSPHAIAQNSNGRLVLEMGPAVVRNEVAALALSGLASLASARARQEAAVECAFGDFDLRDGVARPDRGLVFHLGSIALFGKGKVDLGKERLKLEFDRVAQELSASGVLPPFKLKGSLRDPKPSLSATALAGMAIDLGGELLGAAAGSQGLRSKDCRALWVAYGEHLSMRKSTVQQLRDQGGKELVDQLKRLFH